MKKFKDIYDRIFLVFLSRRIIRVMKLSLFISMLAVFQLWATDSYSQLTKLTLNLENSTVADALKEIENHSDFYFLYSPRLIDVDRKVTVSAENEPIRNILTDILSADVEFKVFDKQIILTPKEKGSSFNIAALRKITGKVTDKDGAPVPGVYVMVVGTNNVGTTTDANGNYNLDFPANAKSLTFSCVGMESQTIAVGDETVVNVVMQESSIGLGEVVVTALGRSKESKKLGFSADQLKGADMAVTRQINPVNSLQGKVAGLQIDQGIGGQFGSSRIVIRGNSTLGKNNQPIFVVDGVIVDNDAFTGGKDWGNDLKNLNPEDFESVTVLKGSAAAALYGSRAINGVILINTKKGKKTPGLGIDFSQSFMIYDPYKGPDFQNEFGGGTVGAFFTDTREPNYKPNESWYTKIFPTDPLTGDPYIDRQIGREGENWGPRMLGQKVLNYDGTWTTYSPQPNNFLDAYQQGAMNSTNLAFQGATDKATFRFSYSRDDQMGVMAKSGLLKNGFNLRTTYDFTKFLSADISMDYASTDMENAVDGGIGWQYMWVTPRNYDTRYWQQRSNYISKLGGAPNAWDPAETNKDPLSGIWFGLYENSITRQDQSVRGRVALTAKLTDWSSLILEGNLSNIFGKQESKMLGTGRNFDGGSYSLGHSEKNSNFLKWMWTFNNIKINKDFRFNAFVGGESQRIFRTYTSGSTSGGLLIPGNYFISNSKNAPSVGGGISYNKVINSLYSSADLEWKNQLFLTGTWRGDWSSALTYADGSGNNFYNYPAGSLAWLFSESFKLPKAITFGKLRASLAALGKDTDPFILNPGYYFSGAITGQEGDPSSATFSSSTTLSPNIKPERKIAQEIGMEMRFLNNRVGFDVSLYKDNTYNQIIDISTPIESGVTGIKINAGNIQNKGIEITLDGTPVVTRDFKWYSRLVWSRNRNLIVELSDGRTEYPLGGDAAEVSSWAVVGKSYGVIRSTIAAERFDNTADVNDPRNGMPILSWRSDARAAFPARSNKWKDLGDINAKFRAGWSNDFSYKNWSLNVLFDAKVGGDMAITALRFGLHTGALPSTLDGRDAEHGGITWTSKYDGQTYDDGLIVDGVFAPGQQVTLADGSKANVGGMTFKEAYEKGFVEPTHAPQFYYRYGSSSTGVIDYAIVESTWVNLRQLALSYNLPKTLCDKLKLNSVTLSLIGRDLFYLYNSLPYNINPASLNSTYTSAVGELGVAPMVRSVGGSIKISF